MQRDEPLPPATPDDETRHGPVPPMGPGPVPTEPGRAPIPNPDSPGDNPVVPPTRQPFPDGSEVPERRLPNSQ